MRRASEGAEKLRLAESQLAAGRFNEAVETLRAAVRAERHAPRPRLMLAYALWRADARDEAIRVLRRLIEEFPSNADAWFNLGNLLRANRGFEQAAHAFRRAGALQPANEAPPINLGLVLVQQGKFDEADAAIRESLLRFPDEPDLLVNLAQVCRVRRRWNEALELLDRCIGLAPKHAGYRVARALARHEAGHTAGALQDVDLVIAHEPGNAEARFAKAQVLLSCGEFESGWAEYRWRPDRLAWLRRRAMPLDSPLPALDSMRDREVILCGEQGLGDTLFFTRFVTSIAKLASAVHLDVDARLRPILPQGWFSSTGPDAARILVGDLPSMLNAGAAPSIRLAPDAARVAAMRDRLATCGPPPYMGITWQAGIRWEDMRSPGDSLFKRVPPEALGDTLRSAPGTLVSLQRGGDSNDLNALGTAAQHRIHDFSWVNQELQDALALLAVLDDYIAVSNTNVHLNEALGKRTRVLVTYPAEWRWMASGERSPWFDQALLYRQARDGSWDSALERLEGDLARQ
ncbi:MAG: tetratricopeptide repeat protein [Betaproteobacteria bacterium]|nr:MAG: tetratricopeptide repeat protein [Betaproteobacteria bacterium]